MLFSICIGLLVLLLAVPTSAEEYYVSPDGKPENNGTRESPWPSVEHALSVVGGGHTILLRPGAYRGPIRIDTQYAGTEARPTVLRSEEKWKATIIGAEYHGISTGGDCHWVVIDGVEVLGARYDGIKISGDHGTVRNCWVHNNGHMGIAMHNRVQGVIENNLIEFNGCHIQFHHGVYASGDGLAIRNNIVRHNSGFGLHLYSAIKNSVISGNLVYGHPIKPGIIVACPEGGGRNTVVNNTVVRNRTAISIWNGDGEMVANNVLDAGESIFQFTHNTKNVTVEHNLYGSEPDTLGAHGMVADPLFVDPDRGVFWLRPESPAIGRAAPRHAPARDFWGRPQDRSPDLGAFPFEPALARDDARESWYYGWAYEYAPTRDWNIVDLWTLPDSLKTR